MTTTLLEIRSLEKSFGGSRVVAGIDLALSTNETKIIVGPNGAGKSTLFRLITGNLQHDHGSIVYSGREIGGLPAYRRQRLGISQSFQTPRLAQGLSVWEHLYLSATTGVNLLRSLATFNHAGTKKITEEIVAKMKLDVDLESPVTQLSHANRKKLDVCCALVQFPKLLLMDEPTAGLGVKDALEVADLIRELEGHMSILVIEHDMRFVRALGRQVVVLHQGAIIRSGLIRDLESDSLVQQIYFGNREVRHVT